MNPTIQSIKERRAIRAYKDKPIEKEKIDEIINCGLMAPSARNLQPWKFVAVTDKKFIKEMAERVQSKVIGNPRYSFVKERSKTKQDAIFYSAPLVVFILGNEKSSWHVIDCSLAAENMMLAAHSLGIGSCPIGMARFLAEEKDIIKRLKFPEGHNLVLTLVFGYADEKPAPRERNKEAVEWIK